MGVPSTLAHTLASLVSASHFQSDCIHLLLSVTTTESSALIVCFDPFVTLAYQVDTLPAVLGGPGSALEFISAPSLPM